MRKKEIKNVLELHKKWMNSEDGGQLRSTLDTAIINPYNTNQAV
ncbi:hypothetical protein P4562_23970 [Lysinibacillus xylanilyticus]|nr:hypothetical protein [Lysinibacillus xylanilyticus]